MKRRKTVVNDDDFSQASEADLFHEGNNAPTANGRHKQC